jgi:hypothetical protein
MTKQVVKETVVEETAVDVMAIVETGILGIACLGAEYVWMEQGLNEDDLPRVLHVHWDAQPGDERPAVFSHGGACIEDAR